MNERLLLFDLETSPNIGYVWGKHEQEVIEFVEESEIISVAYKWLGKKQIKAFCLYDFNGKNKKLIGKLHQLFDEASIICGHNSNSFDIKVANRSFIKYGFPPPSPYKQIDTLSIARQKFRFNSNRLNDLSIYLGIGKKVDTGGFELWKKCFRDNDVKSWRLMKKYNRMDVELLEKVYLRLRPYMNTHPVVSTDNELICPVCGSDHLQSRGWVYMNVFKKRRVQCQNCFKWFYGEQIRFKDKHKVLK